MQIVIDIPEKEYQNYLKMRPAYPEDVFCYIKAIRNGTPLHKGHGRLIDADAFESRCMFDSSINDIEDVIYALNGYESIIEADKEEVRTRNEDIHRL